MSAANQLDEKSPPPAILKPYMPDPNAPRQRRRRAWIVGGLVAFCLIYGLAFAFLAPFLLMFFLIPIGILGALVVWALPQTRVAPTRTLERLFFAFLIVLVLWPSYLAIALPGLPWITLVRLTGAPLALVLLICVSMSAEFRAQLGAVLAAERAIVTLILAFVGIEAISIFLSKSPFFSLDKFITAQISWTAVFFVSCYVFSKPGRVERFAGLLWAMTIPIGLIAIDEYRHSTVFWAGHIPSFLRIADESVSRSLGGQMRAYSDRYRAHSVFTTSLGLAEYLAITTPFVLHFLGGDFKRWVRWAAVASVPFILLIVVLTNARLGLIGFCMSLLFYLLIWGARRWKRSRADMLAPAVVLGYPVVFIGFLAATVFVGRLHRMIWGGGEYAASTEARVTQINMGLPMIAHNPLGYGIGRAAETLGYYQPGGLLTIDTYFLAVALEYGIAGFLLYYGIIVLAIYKSAKFTIYDTDLRAEQSFILPASISLTNFLIIKSVFSQQDNHPIIFMIFGLVVGISYCVKSSFNLKNCPSNLLIKL